MKISFKKKLFSLLTVVTLTIPLLPQIPLTQVFAWTPSFTNKDPGAYGSGMTNNYPVVKQGAKELDRITFVNSVTGESAFPSFFVSSQQIEKTYNLNTIMWSGNGTYGKSKLDYLVDTSYEPMRLLNYVYIPDFPRFIGAGTVNEDEIRKNLSKPEFVEIIITHLKAMGVTNAEDVLHNQSAYKILIEPTIIVKMTNGDVIAMTAAELAMRNMASGGDWYTFDPKSFWASNGPEITDQLGSSAQVDKPHTFTRGGGITINPYSDDQDADGVGGKVPRGNGVWLYNNVTMLKMMGIAILSPDTMPPNYQATELEAEYLPASNEVKVRALSALDPKNSWKYDGLNNELQSWSEYKSLTKDGLIKASEKPAYTPGFTKSMVYLTWGSDYDKKTGKGAVYEDGKPLYIENMKAYPIPKDENYLNINTTLDKYTTPDLKGSTFTTASDGKQIMRQDGEWTYFKLPEIPAGESKIVITLDINKAPYRNSSELGNSTPVGSEYAPDKQDHYFQIQEENFGAVENNFNDNKLEVTLNLGNLDLKVGGSDPNDRMKLDVHYDYANNAMCIIAPAIFDKNGAKKGTSHAIIRLGDKKQTNIEGTTETNPTIPDSSGESEVKKSTISTSHTVYVTYKDAGTTVYTDGTSETHNAGDIVKIGGKELKWSRFIKDWEFNEKDKWKIQTDLSAKTGIKFFNIGDYPTGVKVDGKYQVSGSPTGQSSPEFNYCFKFPLPSQRTKYEIVEYVNDINPNDPATPLPEPNNPSPPEPDLTNNIAKKEIEIGPGVNFSAVSISGNPQPSSYIAGNPDYSKPYCIDLKASGVLKKLVGMEKIDTNSKMYIAPENHVGVNPFLREFQNTETGEIFMLPYDTSGKLAMSEDENNNFPNYQIMEATHNGVTIANNKFEDSYRFCVTEGNTDFLVPEGTTKTIWFMYYVNPSNKNPGIPDNPSNGKPVEDTYYDNMVMGSITLTSTSAPPVSPPGSVYQDPTLNCLVYVGDGNQPIGASGYHYNAYYYMADALGRVEDNSDKGTGSNAINPGTLNPVQLQQKPYGGSFTVLEMPANNWGYRHYTGVTYSTDESGGYIPADSDYEEVASYGLLCEECGNESVVTDEMRKSICPDIFMSNTSDKWNEQVNKYLTYEDGKLKVKYQRKKLYIEFYTRHPDCHCGDCECEGCNCSSQRVHWARLKDKHTTSFTVMFDNMYMNQAGKSRVFSMQGRGTKYDYLLSAGYGIGTVLRVRFISDFLPQYACDLPNAQPFDMSGEMKFSMSSRALNSDELTNGGYPLEVTEKDSINLSLVSNGGGDVSDSVGGYTLKYLFEGKSTEPNEVLLYGNHKIRAGWDWEYQLNGVQSDGDYPELYYFKLEPKARKDSQGNMVRQTYTNKDYPDAVKIHDNGTPVVSGTLPPGYSPDRLEKTIGFVGLKVIDVAWINNRTIKSGKYLTSEDNPQIPEGAVFKPVLGVCFEGNLAIINSMENNEWVRPADLDEIGHH